MKQFLSPHSAASSTACSPPVLGVQIVKKRSSDALSTSAHSEGKSTNLHNLPEEEDMLSSALLTRSCASKICFAVKGGQIQLGPRCEVFCHPSRSRQPCKICGPSGRFLLHAAGLAELRGGRNDRALEQWHPCLQEGWGGTWQNCGNTRSWTHG